MAPGAHVGVGRRAKKGWLTCSQNILVQRVPANIEHGHPSHSIDSLPLEDYQAPFYDVRDASSIAQRAVGRQF